MNDRQHHDQFPMRHRLGSTSKKDQSLDRTHSWLSLRSSARRWRGGARIDRSWPSCRFRLRPGFEWTKQQFQNWANRVAGQHGYTVRFVPVGPVDEAVGSPTQMAVFEIERSKS